MNLSNYASHYLVRLRRHGPINPYAVAFILTEMKFRGPFFRFCEFWYSLLWILTKRCDPKVTLGRCQVSFSYWRRYFGPDNVALFLGVLNDVTNYEICCLYLSENKTEGIDQMIIRYNGKPSKLYVQTYFENLKLVAAHFADWEENRVPPLAPPPASGPAPAAGRADRSAKTARGRPPPALLAGKSEVLPMIFVVPHGAPEGYEWLVALVTLVCLYFAVRNFMRARR